jgi:23S rRNA pseudouridine1911/1915/1917 synthase
MTDPTTIIIQEEEAGIRLDKILSDRYKELHSRTYFQSLIGQQLILVNGIPVKKRLQPKVGDEVEVNFALTEEIDLLPEPIPLEVLFEDDDLIVINKPAGLVVHPAPGHWTGTFVNALLHHCQALKTAVSGRRPGIVHRLDKETTGVMIAAKNLNVQQKLIEKFALREVRKEYLAICVGNPGKVKISAPIGRHPVHRQQMAVVEEGGREAITFAETLQTQGNLSLVQVLITTGRTHQIRVHMKHHGTPVLGDSLYGNLGSNKKYQAMRQLLHAHSIRLTHPMTGKEMEFQAPVPLEMRQFFSGII